METKERKNTNTSSRSENLVKGVETLEMKFAGNKYYIQFTSTGEKIKDFMHDIHKLSVKLTITQMTAKKDSKNHGEREW